MQSASDIFLGWTKGDGRPTLLCPAVARHEDQAAGRNLRRLAALRLCRALGWTLARAHARTGDAAMISGYLGKNDVFDEPSSGLR